MDYSHLLSPGVVIAMVVVLGGLAVQIIADARRAVASRRLYTLLFAQLRQRQAKPVTIVIELRRAAETVLPLLDHLQQQKYAKLTVVVVIRQTAGSRAQAKLVTYRRAQGYSQLRLVKHRKGMTILSVIRRYAPRGLVLQLSASDRVGHDFFQQLSFHFADTQVEAVVPRMQPLLTTHLASALQVICAVWRDLRRSLMTQPRIDNSIRPGTVYRTTSLLNDKPTLRAIYSQAAYLSYSPQPRVMAAMVRASTRRRADTAWLMVALIALSVYGLTATDGTLSFFLLVMYCVMTSIRLATMKGYSLLDKLTVILFVPLSTIAFAGVAIASLAIRIFRHLSLIIRVTKVTTERTES